MKTLTRHFFNNQQPLQCTSELNFLRWLQSFLRRAWYPVSILWSSLKTSSDGQGISNNSNSVNNSNKSTSLAIRLRALAGQVAAVRKTFPRVIVGLVFLIVVAPYADIFYTRLDFNDRVSPEVWYYESYHWLFLCLGPYLKGIITALAYYLIFNVRGAWIFAPVAAYGLMYDIGKVLWLLQVSNHEEYKALPTNWFLAYGFLAGLFLVLMFDRLTYWLNHRVEAVRRRLQGLRNIADKIDGEALKDSFIKTMDADVKVQQFKHY